LRRFSQELGKDMHGIAAEALESLGSYSWPGNVRELQSVLKKAMLHATGPVLLAEFLPDPVRKGAASSATDAPPADSCDFPDLARYIQDRIHAGTTDLHAEMQAVMDRVLLLSVLAFTSNNLTQAARMLGISRATLRSRLSALGVTMERSTSIEEESPGD